jgi:hypothetical protein
VEKPEQFAAMQLNPGGNSINLDAEYLASLATAPESMRRRFYLGEYADSNNLTVFPFPTDGYYAGRQFEDWVAKVGPGNVRFTAGLDLGFEDADGFCIIAYVPKIETPTSRPRDEIEAARRGREIVAPIPEGADKRWLIYEHKARRSGLAELAEAVRAGLKWADTKAQELGLPSSNIVIYSDTGGGGAKMVYDLRTVHKLPVLPAYKRDKIAAIELLQDEVKSGQFMVPADGAFAQEAEAIVWTKDPETGEIMRTIDDKQYHPDLMDAILYAMRFIWYTARR